MQKEFSETLKEYLDLKKQLFEKFDEIKKYEYRFDTPNIGEYWGWYELCEAELEIYDNLQLIYEDQDKGEEEILNFSVERYMSQWGILDLNK